MGLGWSRGPRLPDSHRGSIHDAPEMPRRVDVERPEEAGPDDPAPAGRRGVLLAVAVIVAVIAMIVANAAAGLG